ncbi:PAAR-like domain-containing protein [Pyxidicoccus trucidator]|uniref:PAAR-like domain-containing protein n=1 Tax=Pyxidicoccus trucidator TaxID=2709662 RepID=UPI0013D9EE5A|nr:PAAR-like domain-containing protein [Pyxidicoccus trucidator]
MSDKHHVFVNGMTPVTSESEGKVVGFPDVCKTPSPGGPVPIPYPNLAQSKDLENGSKRVSINGTPVALRDSYLGTSTGNEAGTAGGGAASGKTKGRAHPVNYSFDVKIEGKPVVRNFDLFTLNDHNAPPFPIIQPQGTPPVAGRVEEVKLERPMEKCDWCGKQKHDFDRKGRVGSNLGSSAVLGRNMLEGRELATHPWYAGPFSLAAHHLICLEALDTPRWAEFCPRFGYHPDRKPNGVFLPMKLALACQLFVAVHRGHHAEGFAFDLHLAYPDAVMSKLRTVAKKLEGGEYCSNPETLLEELDDLSAEILAKVDSGLWTLTRDGEDYALGGRGCAGLTSIREKPTHATCPHGRRHQLKHAVTGRLLARHPLKPGE